MHQASLPIFFSLILGFAMTAWGEEPLQAASSGLATQLGELIDRDWDDRPPWADMAVAVLKGEAMGSGHGWFTGSQRRHGWDWLAETFDEAAADGQIRRNEIKQLSKVDFDRIDTDQDGRITPNDFQFTKNPLLEDDSPVGGIFSRLDEDSNGRLTKQEFERWFDRSADGDDFLSVEDLKDALGMRPKRTQKKTEPSAGDPRWRMLELLVSGEMGTLAEGPDLDEQAPKVDLPLVAINDDGDELQLTDRIVKLSDSRGMRPVVLIFGSFT